MNSTELKLEFPDIIPVGDKGFIRFLDVMGDDQAIVDAARISYGAGTKSVSDDRALIRYLLRHHHSSPLEMCEIKLHLKLPIHVMRQLIRHRTASINEVSTRYSLVQDQFEDPLELRLQAKDNKQGSAGLLECPEGLIAAWEDQVDSVYQLYTDMINAGVAREQARSILPLSTYTEVYWKMDLRNLFHFLALRMDSHAQLEIREFANAIAEIVKRWVPLAWEAFVDYQLEAVTFSRYEHELLVSVLAHFSGHDNQVVKSLIEEMLYEDQSKLTGRELKEFLAKL